ncbi:MAG: HD domain-containing protein [Myxococcota bacterium]
MSSDPRWSVPELAPSGAGQGVIRLPEFQSVPITPAVTEVIDHPHFQRLRRVRQLGPTFLVYPGAVHTRFEHSVGVYGTTVRYLQSLLQHESVRQSLDEAAVRTVLMAGLLHDLGHYPFAHTLEALHHRGQDTPKHEDLAGEIIFGRAPGLAQARRPISEILRRSVGVDPERVVRLITASRRDLADPVDRLLQSVVSSALDADKMDYLWRDSVHLGVPYGRNYDRERLLNALTVSADGDALAVTSKGVISAEIFLFCRYTMFSEVYWHHTVRSLSAMLERAWADVVIRDRPSHSELVSRLLGVGDDVLLDSLAAEAPPRSVAARILGCITRDRRAPYKRLITWSRVYDDPDKREAYERLYAMERSDADTLVERLRHVLGREGRPLPEGALILDVPPRDKDHLPDVAVHHPRAGAGQGAWTTLARSSRIVAGIGEDFVKVVKKIRLFAHPHHAPRLEQDPAALERRVHEVVMECTGPA